MKLLTYIRGGLGDIHIAVTALKPIIEKNKIEKNDITIVLDSIYFMGKSSVGIRRYILDMLYKLSPRVIVAPNWVNNNFQISIDDVSNELSQENADRQRNIFMFWRMPTLKKLIKEYMDEDTIFIDCPFTECIMQWDFKKKEYKRIPNERSTLEFNPPQNEKEYIDKFLKEHPRHILLHVRKKQEGTSHTDNNEYYQTIVTYCNENKIDVILVGIDNITLYGKFANGMGDNLFSLEGMGYFIDKCKVMVGNDSAFSHIKLYQKQKDKLLIMNHARYERASWCYNAHLRSNCLLLDAKKNETDRMLKSIGEYYENK